MMNLRLLTLAASVVWVCLAGPFAYGQYGPPGVAGARAGARPAFRVNLAADESASPSNRSIDTVPQPVLDGPYLDDKFFDGKPLDCKDAYACPTYSFRAFADFLYLRPRDAEVAYAVEANLNVPVGVLPPVQTSPIALVDQDYSSGFRVGFAVCLDDCSEIGLSYTKFDSSTSHSITRNPNRPLLQIFPMTIHPATQTAITGTVEAAANYGVDFDLVDLDFRRALLRTGASDVFGVVGVRYGKLEQDLFARYSDLLNGPNEIEVLSDITFEGVGLKLGLEWDHYSSRRPVMMYMKGGTSLLAGEFDAIYQQTVQNNAQLGVDTAWTAGRIVPTFDLEVGTGYYSPEGRLRATVGYVYSVWTNVVKTQDWIHGVQSNQFGNLDDSITFDGLVLRVEGRF